jgi:hypothetical protein
MLLYMFCHVSERKCCSFKANVQLFTHFAMEQRKRFAVLQLISCNSSHFATKTNRHVLNIGGIPRANFAKWHIKSLMPGWIPVPKMLSLCTNGASLFADRYIARTEARCFSNIRFICPFPGEHSGRGQG